MGKLRSDEILKRVEKEGFERVWRESVNLIPKSKKKLKLEYGKRGVSHPLFDVRQKLREFFIDLGFSEVSNPVIVDENEVYKQYGPEAPVILDRCYYLATLPRPDIGLNKKKFREIEGLGVQLTEEKVAAFRGVLRNYKRGKIAADEFVEEMAEVLVVSDSTATSILSQVFPEFEALKPRPSTLTLRSHMTSAWFLTMQTLQHQLELPIKLFSVDIRFRREQSEDPTHLRSHYTASCVVMDDEINVKAGEEITNIVLKPLGIKQVRFERKRVTSKYYTPGTEYEGYIFHPRMSRWIEVVNYGLYNPIALARYDLEYPVLNVGIGVERVALVLYGENDMRSLVYPQFYAERTFSDAEMAKMVGVDLEPHSDTGMKIRDAIKSKALKHAEETSPCEFLAYEGEMFDKVVKVYVYETDDGVKLLGPAARNNVYVYDGSVLGIPEEGIDHASVVREAREKGIRVGFSYLHAVASLAVVKIEEAIRLNRKKVNVRVKMAKYPSDVNVKISDVARRSITSNNKKIEVTGPVFIGIRAEIN